MSSWPATLPTAAGTYLRGLFTGDQSHSVLPFIPRSLRVLFLLVLIVNYRSLPFTWHYRLFRQASYLRFKGMLLSFLPGKKDAWLDSLCPIGMSPFELTSSYSTWASPDESDYNIHLSNSSYAKISDMCRMKFALAYLSSLFRDGCWIALGATHLKFIREIPLGTKYEVRMYVGSWDTKWMYVLARFVSKGKGKTSSNESKTRERLEGANKVLQDKPSSYGSIPIPQLHTPAAPDASGFTTPNLGLITSPEEFDALWTEAPDETLHCVAMNEVCFKHGRVTVPPALTLAAAGCGLSKEKFAELKKMRAGRQMRDLLVGGWRKVPENERWWDEAFRPYEHERVRRLNVLKGMHEGIEAARLL